VRSVTRVTIKPGNPVDASLKFRYAAINFGAGG
jgi:hypothetical protein